MTTLDSHKRYLVVGSGKTGQSVARYLKRSGLSFAMVDSRESPPTLDQREFADVDVISGGFSCCNFSDFDVLVVSPGISVHTPEIAVARNRGAEIIGDIELFARDINHRSSSPTVVAVTGSNGKSTVVSMLGAILLAAGVNAAVGGNLGTPALDMLQQSPDADIYVLELSSFQLETTFSLRPGVASVLNVSEDHMDRYATLDEYAEAKRRIYFQSACCVHNANDILTTPQHSASSVSFTGGADVGGDFALVEGTICKSDQVIFNIDQLRVPGRHNAVNALAAIAMAKSLPGQFEISNEAINRGLSGFAGLPHRTQWVAGINGVEWYNDSKGTNVGATLAAVQGLGRPVVLIAGGDGKGADFSPLAAVHEHCRAAVLIGRDAPLIADALRGKVNTVIETGMRPAVATAQCLACSGDAVLLSPACASFDMYSSYEARGDDFIALVQELVA